MVSNDRAKIKELWRDIERRGDGALGLIFKEGQLSRAAWVGRQTGHRPLHPSGVLEGRHGELMPAFEPREIRDEASAARTAKEMAHRHVCVITRTRTADLVNGIFGEPVVLFRNGDGPELE